MMRIEAQDKEKKKLNLSFKNIDSLLVCCSFTLYFYINYSFKKVMHKSLQPIKILKNVKYTFVQKKKIGQN